jgi:hypothetical protein
MVIETFTNTITTAYNEFLTSLPNWAQNFMNLFLLVLLVFLYAMFIWKFYRFIATKNIFGLDLNKYNHSDSPTITKILAGGFYFLEYLIILPFVIFFGFAIFTIFLIFLTDSLEVSTLLTISAVIIAVIRMSCYYNENLAKDLAKLLPFTLLAISLVNPNFFDFNRILGNITELPSFFNKIIIYLAFIIGLEIVLRLFDFIFSLFGLEDAGEAKEDIEEIQKPEKKIQKLGKIKNPAKSLKTKLPLK